MADVLKNLSFSMESQNMLDFFFYCYCRFFNYASIGTFKHTVSLTLEKYMEGTVPGLVEQ